ncbi:MAG TPA: hypothetical protein VLX28_20450 [Thermoanaerobaculia bacterium]|nr:hypothetical protein [Thermoanaerobaculia bacterium]
MRGFVAVFEREIVERRLLLLGALILGLVPLAAPLVPGLPAASPAEVRSGVALGLALIISLVLALFLGGSVIARDLGERRLGFYFARPLTGGAIWGGKLAAAAALAAGAGALALLPVLCLGEVPDPGGYWGSFVNGGAILGRAGLATVWLVVLVLVVLVSHAGSVILRSRSPWLFLDLAALGLTVATGWICLGILARDGAGLAASNDLRQVVPSRFLLLQYIELAVAAVVILALATAGAAQVSRGRTDLHRGHRILSLVLWGILLPASLALAGYTAWFESPSPRDLVSVDNVMVAPAGPWIALYGQTAHRGGYLPGFLLDAGTGRFVRANFGMPSWYRGRPPFVRFAADSRRVAWLQASGDPGWPDELDLMTLDLRRPGASPRPAQLALKTSVSAFALSPDASRVSAVQNRRWIVAEVDSGRLLASAPVPEDYHPQEFLVFTGPGRVRRFTLDAIWSPQRTQEILLTVWDLDVASGKVTHTDVRETVMGNPLWLVSPTGDHWLLRTGKALQLRDGATGKLIAEIGGKEDRASFLPDGRIALLARPQDGSDLKILDPATGAELRRFHFPVVRTVLVADQPGPDRLRVVTRGPEGTAPWQLWTLDLATGEAHPGPRLALTSLPLRRTSGWRPLRGDGIVWSDPWNTRAVAVLRTGLPAS